LPCSWPCAFDGTGALEEFEIPEIKPEVIRVELLAGTILASDETSARVGKRKRRGR
jgi:hypothetical protein